MTSTTATNKYPWGILIAIMLFGCITGVFLNTVGVFFQPISEYLQIGRGQFSLAYTCQCLVTFLALMFSGKLLAKYPNKIRLILTAATLIRSYRISHFCVRDRFVAVVCRIHPGRCRDRI